jgi:hypothetical protein
MNCSPVLRQEKSAAENLALTYGPKEDRVALERQATRLAANVSVLLLPDQFLTLVVDISCNLFLIACYLAA